MKQISPLQVFPKELGMTATASEDFKSNILEQKRYVDKTQILIPLLQRRHEVFFFLRPRRFGKTLTLSMLRYFWEDTKDEALNAENRKLFDGMKIMQAGSFYTDQMTSFPVVHLTFQGVKGDSFQDAYGIRVNLIQALYNRHRDLLDSQRLTEVDKEYFRRIWIGRDPVTKEKTPISDDKLSLMNLTYYLRTFYGKRTVVLMDEYDVPLGKAYQGGYHPEMINVISGLLQNVPKTNSENLPFAVVTGCLRIARESIYTGLNNPDINTVLSYQESDVIGFTEDEVRELLMENALEARMEDVKAWYDGYTFGNTVIYNPWSVIKFIENAKAGDPAEPREHWGNTSGNGILKELAVKGSRAVKDKVESLMRGETICFEYSEYIVYSAILKGGTEGAEAFQGILKNEILPAISYYDTVEAFYHGILLALMASNQDYVVSSNRENGLDRFDVESKMRYDLENGASLGIGSG